MTRPSNILPFAIIRPPRGLTVMAFLLCQGVALTGCQGGSFVITTSGLPEITEDYALPTVTGELWCDEGDNETVCVLELHGDDLPPDGEARSLSLHLPPEAGNGDLSKVPRGYLPVAYAHTDDVLGEDASFDWGCTYDEGTITLDSAPVSGEWVEGSLDVTLRCEESLSGRVEEGVGLEGTFRVLVDGHLPKG